MTQIEIDTVTGLPTDTSHGITCGRCTSALQRRVRHQNVTAVRECDRLSRIQDEVEAVRYLAELGDAKRAAAPRVPLVAYHRP